MAWIDNNLYSDEVESSSNKHAALQKDAEKNTEEILAAKPKICIENDFGNTAII